MLKEEHAQTRYNDDIAEEVALIRSSVIFEGFGDSIAFYQHCFKNC